VPDYVDASQTLKDFV